MQVCKTLQWVAKRTQKSQSVVNFTYVQLTCDQLVSTCVVWPNGEKLALTCVPIWARPRQRKPSQNHANQRKWVAKRNPSWTQVENLRWLLACLFGQGLRPNSYCTLIIANRKSHSMNIAWRQHNQNWANFDHPFGCYMLVGSFQTKFSSW